MPPKAKLPTREVDLKRLEQGILSINIASLYAPYSYATINKWCITGQVGAYRAPGEATTWHIPAAKLVTFLRDWDCPITTELQYLADLYNYHHTPSGAPRHDKAGLPRPAIPHSIKQLYDLNKFVRCTDETELTPEQIVAARSTFATQVHRQESFPAPPRPTTNPQLTQPREHNLTPPPASSVSARKANKSKSPFTPQPYLTPAQLSEKRFTEEQEARRQASLARTAREIRRAIANSPPTELQPPPATTDYPTSLTKAELDEHYPVAQRTKNLYRQRRFSQKKESHDTRSI